MTKPIERKIATRKNINRRDTNNLHFIRSRTSAAYLLIIIYHYHYSMRYYSTTLYYTNNNVYMMRAYTTICDIYYYDKCVLLITLLRNRTTRTSTFGDQVRRTRRLGIPTRRRTAIFCRCNCCPRAGRASGA